MLRLIRRILVGPPIALLIFINMFFWTTLLIFLATFKAIHKSDTIENILDRVYQLAVTVNTEIFKKIYPCRKHKKHFPVGENFIRHREPCQINYLWPGKPAARTGTFPAQWITLRRTEDLAPVRGSSSARQPPRRTGICSRRRRWIKTEHLRNTRLRVQLNTLR